MNPILEYVYIRTEVKKRELISRLDIAVELLGLGINVVIGEQNFNGEILRLSQGPAYFFGKCAQSQYIDFYQNLVNNQWALGSLDEEGLLPYNLKSFMETRFSHESNQYFDEIFFFGTKQQEYFQSYYSRNQGLYCYGNPRIDAWTNHYYGIHDHLSNLIHQQVPSFVLFPLNYCYYTSSPYKKMALNSRSNSKLKQMKERSEYLFDESCKLAESIAREIGHNVVFRPHPGDSCDEIIQLMKKHGVTSSKVLCNDSYEVWPWIKNATILVHNCCTTSLEAGFSGTPVLSFTPSNVSLYEADHVNSLFQSASTLSSALAIISSGIDAATHNKLFLENTKNFDMLETGYCGISAKHIASTIASSHRFRIKSNSLAFRRSMKSRFIHSSRQLRSRLGSMSHKVYLQKMPSLSIYEIQGVMNSLCRHKRINLQLNFKQVSPRLVYIERV
jgi:surface carbohydrate biosynthesis protein